VSFLRVYSLGCQFRGKLLGLHQDTAFDSADTVSAHTLPKQLFAKDITLIGVISKENERETVLEFFELFKTPWEFYKKNKTYDVVLLTCDPQCEIKAKLLIIYGGQEDSFGHQHKLKPTMTTYASTLHDRDLRFPIYGKVSSFHESAGAIIRTIETNDIVAVLLPINHQKVIRVGFNLFQEVEYLFRHGQPSQYALFPTIDIHIAVLRDWIFRSGITLIEVLNSPYGFDFTVCLSHDIDFIRIRDHKFDHTMFGFLYRSLFISFIKFLKGKLSFLNLLKNLGSACFLPCVYLGIIKDYFFQFDKYLEVEKDLASTFFILPFKNRPGIDSTGQTHRARAARYDINDIEPEIKKLILAGREIALHGIDAWRDPVKGREELQRIARITGNNRVGIRSHWLYRYEKSPQHLEEAGFIYDSSVGYNDTIGYHSGTTQVFRPLRAATLFELPLHIMDTALFYAGHMDLAEPQAMDLVEGIIANAQRFGGVLTINWHDRSMGPERFWGTFYKRMLARLKDMRVWFATASQAVSWFSARRSVSFNNVRFCNNELKISLSSSANDTAPLLLRVHVPQEQGMQTDNMLIPRARIMDISFSGDLEISLRL